MTTKTKKPKNRAAKPKPKPRTRPKAEFCPTCGQRLHDTHDLTDRQKEIVRMVGQGLSSPRIAEHLGISHRTVEFHRSIIMNRLRLSTATELAAYAALNGYVRQS